MSATALLRFVLVPCLLAALAACGLFGNVPEYRANDYVKALVRTPDDRAVLAALAAPDRDPQTIVAGLHTQVAIDYLRTQHRQGRRHDFLISATRPEGSGRRLVAITVTPLGGPPGEEPVRIRVRVEEYAGAGWRVTEVQAE
jgi:hypothetical protein